MLRRLVNGVGIVVGMISRWDLEEWICLKRRLRASRRIAFFRTVDGGAGTLVLSVDVGLRDGDMGMIGPERLCRTGLFKQMIEFEMGSAVIVVWPRRCGLQPGDN